MTYRITLTLTLQTFFSKLRVEIPWVADSFCVLVFRHMTMYDINRWFTPIANLLCINEVRIIETCVDCDFVSLYRTFGSPYESRVNWLYGMVYCPEFDGWGYLYINYIIKIYQSYVFDFAKKQNNKIHTSLNTSYFPYEGILFFLYIKMAQHLMHLVFFVMFKVWPYQYRFTAVT